MMKEIRLFIKDFWNSLEDGTQIILIIFCIIGLLSIQTHYTYHWLWFAKSDVMFELIIKYVVIGFISIIVDVIIGLIAFGAFFILNDIIESFKRAVRKSRERREEQRRQIEQASENIDFMR